MLRAALIGFPSTGKTTLFQLMTSAKDAPKGKGDVNIGISKVPDPRLDVLTAMYNPKKRVPATVEFTDLIAPPRAGAQGLVDVAAYKNADALVHVVRAFRDPAIAHPAGSIDPARDAQAMEDELILADLGIAERRLERIEKDLKRGKSTELDKGLVEKLAGLPGEMDVRKMPITPKPWPGKIKVTNIPVRQPRKYRGK